MNDVYNIPFHKPTFVNEDLQCLQQAVTEGSWARENQESRLFFEDYYPNSQVFFTNSCSSALELAIRALNIGPGDEVIIPAFGYVAVANAVVNNGAIPVFADVHRFDGNISAGSIAACITKHTKAVIVIHYAGNSADIGTLLKLCTDNNLYLIEDAAQCIGSTYNSKPLGSFGHIACLSFDYMKNVSCGQGGLLIVNQSTLLPAVQTIFDNGTDKDRFIKGHKEYFEWVGKGSNCQINPLASHFLSGQLKALSYITLDRLKKWNLYFELLLPLQKSKKIVLPETRANHNGHIFYLLTQSAAERNDLRNYLKENGILCEHHYTSLAKSPYGKQFVNAAVPTPDSEALSNQLLRLPIWYEMPDDDIRQVVLKIMTFYSGQF